MKRRAAFVLLALAAACDGDPGAGAGTAADGGGSEGGGEAGSADAGPRIRTVERRNPFGNTAAENNLMVDGDFEWTSGSGQHGWRALGGSGELSLERETGGLCRSGVSCGVLGSGMSLIGMAAAPREKPMLITVYSKPPEPDCGLTSVSVISCTSGTVLNLATVSPVSAKPGASGWCQHRALSPPLDEQPCLYIVGFVVGGQRVLIDDASIVSAEGTGASPLSATAPSRELFERVQRDLAWLREHQLFGRSPVVPP